MRSRCAARRGAARVSRRRWASVRQQHRHPLDLLSREDRWTVRCSTSTATTTTRTRARGSTSRTRGGCSERETRQFALTLAITGQGRVGTEPDGQGCETTCTTEWDGGTSIQIAAEPAPGFGFGVDRAVHRRARALLPPRRDRDDDRGCGLPPVARLTVQVTGRGTVAGSELRCSRACSTRVVEGSRVLAPRDSGPRLAVRARSGSCRSARATCTLQVGVGGARAAARFARRA